MRIFTSVTSFILLFSIPCFAGVPIKTAVGAPTCNTSGVTVYTAPATAKKSVVRMHLQILSTAKVTSVRLNGTTFIGIQETTTNILTPMGQNVTTSGVSGTTLFVGEVSLKPGDVLSCITTASSAVLYYTAAEEY